MHSRNLQVIAGNVATGEATKALIDAGVDAVKGEVSILIHLWQLYRNGIGVPQIGCGGLLRKQQRVGISDYCRWWYCDSGDMTKAIAAGANVCMMGSISAGCDESPGTFELYQGRKYKVYRGMGFYRSNGETEAKTDTSMMKKLETLKA